MIHTEKIGNSTGIKIDLQNAPLLLLVARKGFVMCGYLDMDAAEKMNDCACVVSGVKTFEDVLNAKITAATQKAKKLGISEGTFGKDALKLLE